MMITSWTIPKLGFRSTSFSSAGILFWLANFVLCCSVGMALGFLIYWQDLFMIYSASTLFFIALIIIVLDRQDKILQEVQEYGKRK